MILFLDFDGVLHPAVRGKVPFCHTPLLWKILRASPNMRVVFSTSWRDTFDPAAMLDFVTYGGGEDLETRFIGETPNLEDEGLYGRRDLEIQKWLDTNNFTGPWLALDDMVELFGGGHPNLYLIDGNHGLTDADVVSVLERIRNARTNPSSIDANIANEFVETAYTTAEVERANAAERRNGTDSRACAFLDDLSPKKASDAKNEEDLP